MSRNLIHKNLGLAFLIGLIGTLFFPRNLLYFSPFLVILFYKRTLIVSLWGAFCCGIILDLLSSDSRLGMCAINYMLVTTVLYRLKDNFFPDLASTLPFLTLFFTAISSLFEIGILLQHSLLINLTWFIDNVIYLPILTSLYAFTIFIIPSLVFGKKSLRGADYFSR